MHSRFDRFRSQRKAAKINNPCLLSANFADPFDTFGNQGRNQVRGPGHFDTDFAVEKGFGIPKWEGAQSSVGQHLQLSHLQLPH